MSAEVQSYRLSFRGKPAGTHTLTTVVQGGIVFMEGKLQLQGGPQPGTVEQRSRFESGRFHSLQFEEDNLTRGDKRSFVVEFDHSEGLVRARKGQDVSEQPYLKPYRDPLSMLHELRSLDPAVETMTIPMLGKDVTARLVGAAELDTPLGRRNARSYQLQPGGSYLYLDDEAPHLILKMVQRLDEHYLDVVLVRVGHDDAIPEWAARQQDQQQSKRKRPRRRRGRRRRPQSK